jgi:large subunit ribosomal protein L25
LGLNVTNLHLGEHLSASALELPQGVELVTSADAVVAHLEQPRGEIPLTVAGEPGTAEPEVITRGGEKSQEED